MESETIAKRLEDLIDRFQGAKWATHVNTMILAAINSDANTAGSAISHTMTKISDEVVSELREIAALVRESR